MFNQGAQLNGLDAWRRAVRHYDRSFSHVQAELARQHGSVTEPFADMAARSVVERTELEQMNGHITLLAIAHGAVRAHGNFAAFTALHTRLGALDVEVQTDPASAGQSVKGPGVLVDPCACCFAGHTLGADLTVPAGHARRASVFLYRERWQRQLPLRAPDGYWRGGPAPPGGCS